MNLRPDTIFIAIALIACHHVNGISRVTQHNKDEDHERSKRFVFLRTTGVGYLVALAIPTSSVNRQRVYMAFNFEAHYGVIDADTVIQKWKSPFPGDDTTEAKRNVRGVMVQNRNEHLSDKMNVYTRKNFYRILEQHIDAYGYNGTSCVLRAICETSELPFYEYNGVFGNIFHILFTPSSSKAEKIRSDYYEAEYHGQIQECGRYHDKCDISFLDLISDIITMELRKMM